MVNDNTETTSQAARHTAQALRLEWWCLGCGFKNTIRRASLSNRSLSLKPHQIQKLCTLIDTAMREYLTIPCIYHIDNHFILRLNYRWLLVEFPQWNGNHLYVLSWLWLSITVDGWRHNIFLQTLNRALFFFFFCWTVLQYFARALLLCQHSDLIEMCERALQCLNTTLCQLAANYITMLIAWYPCPFWYFLSCLRFQRCTKLTFQWCPAIVEWLASWLLLPSDGTMPLGSV